MSLQEYKIQIEHYDMLITQETDRAKKKQLIQKAIPINEEYARLLRRPIPVKVVFCIILSVFFLLGLMIFLPQIIVRNTKANIVEERVRRYRTMLASL